MRVWGEKIALAAVESTLASVAHLVNLKIIDKEENFVTIVAFHLSFMRQLMPSEVA